MAWTSNWRATLPAGSNSTRNFAGRLAEEGVGERAVLVEVDREDHEPLPAVLALQLVHPWEGLQAGRAPGGPEVDQDDLAGVGVEHRPAGRGLGGRRRGRAHAGGGQGCEGGQDEESRGASRSPRSNDGITLDGAGARNQSSRGTKGTFTLVVAWVRP